MAEHEQSPLKRLTLAEERRLSLLPKPSNLSEKLDASKKSDPLVQALIRYQERFQATTTSISRKTNTLLDYNRRLNIQLRQGKKSTTAETCNIFDSNQLLINGMKNSYQLACFPCWLWEELGVVVQTLRFP
jgi:hypothetical protein